MKKRQVFYFELDALVDTRFGLLVQKWPGLVNVVDLESYRNRKTSYVWEHFGVDKDKWLEAWNARDKELLKHCGPTEMVLRINEMLTTALASAATTPIFEKPSILINIWPYEFDDEESAEVIDGLHEIVLDQVPISIVRLPPEAVTQKWVGANCDSLVIYNFVEWFTVQAPTLHKNPLPHTTIHFPALINEGREDDPHLVKKGIGTAFDELTFTLSEFYNFRAIDPMLYCLPPVGF